VLPVAAYDRTEAAMPFSLNETNRGDHRLSPAGPSDLQVRCERLDDVLPPRVDVVKIDTQGFDHEVIAGLERTLLSNPGIVVLTELSLRELEARRVDAVSVVRGYSALGFTTEAFDDWGMSHALAPEAIPDYCVASGRDEISVVLRR
jgi:hypothetical protein